MTINMQALSDVLVAIVTTVGIAVAVSLLAVAAGAIHQRDQRRAGSVRRPRIPAQHSIQSDEAAELLLR